MEKAEDRSHFLKNVSLLGGVLLAARDTEGKPGLVYLAAKARRALARDTRRTTKRLGRTTGVDHQRAEQERQQPHRRRPATWPRASARARASSPTPPLAGGAALVGAAVAGPPARRARRPRKQLKATQVAAAKQLEEARESPRKQAAVAQKEGAKQPPRSPQSSGPKRSAEAAEAGRSKQIAKKLAKKAGKVNKNIQLGEN